jgi:hypothetical protein
LRDKSGSILVNPRISRQLTRNYPKRIALRAISTAALAVPPARLELLALPVLPALEAPTEARGLEATLLRPEPESPPG